MQVRLQFTLCFIKREEHILLLNRTKPPWQGMWNGIGGKIEPGESPEESIQREVYEEAGLKIDARLKGCVTWETDHEEAGGMYLFVADLREPPPYATPKRTAEGVLDWKAIDWIMSPDNLGIINNIPKFLPSLLEEERLYQHHCVYQQHQLVEYRRKRWEVGVKL